MCIHIYIYISVDPFVCFDMEIQACRQPRLLRHRGERPGVGERWSIV